MSGLVNDAAKAVLKYCNYYLANPISGGGGGSGGASAAEVKTAIETATNLDTVETALTSIVSQTDTLEALVGAATETAPGTDTASSGLNGRLQRLAQSLTLVVGHVDAVEASLTTITAQTDTLEAQVGAASETAPASDTATSGLNGRLQRVAQRLTSLIALLPTTLSNGNLRVSIQEPSRYATATDRSGTTSGTPSTWTQIAASNTTRITYFILNPATNIDNIDIGFGAAASEIRVTTLLPGTSLAPSNSVYTGRIAIRSASASITYVAHEG